MGFVSETGVSRVPYDELSPGKAAKTIRWWFWGEIQTRRYLPLRYSYKLFVELHETQPLFLVVTTFLLRQLAPRTIRPVQGQAYKNLEVGV